MIVDLVFDRLDIVLDTYSFFAFRFQHWLEGEVVPANEEPVNLFS